QPDRLGAALRELRDLHRVPVDVPGVGSAQGYANNMIAARTTALHTAAQRQAEEAIDSAMINRTALSGQQFTDAVIDSDRLEQVGREVLAELARHVEEGLGLVVEDMRAELAFAVRRSAAVDGRAGRFIRRAGYGVGYGGLAVGAVAIGVGLSPVGWAIGTGLLVAAAAGLVSKVVGRF